MNVSRPHGLALQSLKVWGSAGLADEPLKEV